MVAPPHSCFSPLAFMTELKSQWEKYRAMFQDEWCYPALAYRSRWRGGILARGGSAAAFAELGAFLLRSPAYRE